MTSQDHFIGHMESTVYGLAGLAGTAIAVGRARSAAIDEALRQDRQDAQTLRGVEQVARAMTADRLAMRCLQAENETLRAELAAMRARVIRAEAAALRAA